MWKKLLVRLHKSMTDEEIAVAVGCHQTTINRLRRGISKNPSHYAGEGILKLYSKMFKKAA